VFIDYCILGDVCFEVGTMNAISTILRFCGSLNTSF
jgi:hypothetical protein